MKIETLERIRFVCMAVFVATAGWLLAGSLGYLYRVSAPPMRRISPHVGEINYRSREPLSDILKVVDSREMFRQSVYYETRKTQVVNVLEGLKYLGLIQRDGVPKAVILDSQAGTTSMYSISESVGDSTIVEIRSDRVILAHGQEKLELIK